VNIEFQPSGFEKGSYLNVGAQWLWRPFPSFAFEYGDPIRVRLMSDKNPDQFVSFESQEQFGTTVRNLARAGAAQITNLRASFATVDASLRAWRREKDRFAYHLGVAYGLTNRAREAREHFGAARVKDPEHEWQRADNRMIDELNELVGDSEAFRARITKIIQNERDTLKLVRAPNLDLPR